MIKQPIRYRGFTLIELLVVIAIIAILAAILFPVFARAREKARQTACTSNQKQIAATVMMYAQDHEETFPNTATVWSDLKLDADILKCPTKGKRIVNAYGYSNVVSGKSLGSMDDPTTVPLTSDTLNTQTNILRTGGDIDRPHTGKAIASYVDGHVTTADLLGLVTYQEYFSATSMDTNWIFPANPENLNCKIESSNGNYYMHAYPDPVTAPLNVPTLDGAISAIKLPYENIIRGNFRLEMDMKVTNSGITPLFFQNSKNSLMILSFYHHNSGNSWRFETGPSQTWFGPPTPFYNDITQCGALYNTWGRMSFTRIGTQMLISTKPLSGGAPKFWSWTVQGDDIDTIGFATRFAGAGELYWDNIKCVQ